MSKIEADVVVIGAGNAAFCAALAAQEHVEFRPTHCNLSTAFLLFHRPSPILTRFLQGSDYA